MPPTQDSDSPSPPPPPSLLSDRSDTELVDELRRSGCSGTLWDIVVVELVEYALRVLYARIYDGEITRLTAKLGRPVVLTDDEVAELRADEQARCDVVHEAVVKAIELFQARAVLAGDWLPAGGAGLRTFFVNACLLALSNQVKRWRTARRHREREDLSESPLEAQPEDVLTAQPDTVDRIVEVEDAVALLAAMDPLLARATLMRVQNGASWRAVARELGVPHTTIDRLLAEFRHHHETEENP